MNLLDLATSEYPRTLWQFRQDNPNVSFPSDPTDDDLAPFGHANVHPTPQPQDTRTERVEEAPPTFDGDCWRQAWTTRAATPEEIAAWDEARRPAPDWPRFKSQLLANPAANAALAAALPAAPGAALALPAALMATAHGAPAADFYAAWNTLRQTGLIPESVVAAVAALAVQCHLPEEFTLTISRPFAQTVGQQWTDPWGQPWHVIQRRGPDGQFEPDDPATPERDSLAWERGSA